MNWNDSLNHASTDRHASQRWWSRQRVHVPATQRRMPRLTWAEICRRADCGGRWVALHGCTYDAVTGHALDGELVDADADLSALCNRVRDSEWKNCAILFCSDRPV